MDGTDIQRFLQNNEIDAYLMHSNSTCNVDMYYATGFLAGDAFTYLFANKEILLVSGMEKGRAEKESKIKDVRSSSQYGFKEKIKQWKDSNKAHCMVLTQMLEEEGSITIAVPQDFPLFFAQCLKEAGFTIICVTSPFKEMRKIKNDSEIQAITKAQRSCEQAVAQALKALSKAQINDGELILDSRHLTAEHVRAIIHHSLLDSGCEADDTIVACGKGSADPHWRGSGVLMAHEPIVLDVFPRHMFYRYYSDMSRTVVKGEPDPKIKEMHQAVLAAQDVAFNLIKPGVLGSEVHQAVCDSLVDAGFVVGDDEGFIHSTGHSIGLDVHEKPGLGLQEDLLASGNVITVEPGLYYRDVGGVRVEDCVVVAANGCKNLTVCNKNLQV